MKRLPHIHHKTAKGRSYAYFDTGTRNEEGRKIFKRLPSPRDPSFPNAYKLACDQRKRRAVTFEGKTFDGLIRLFEKSPDFKQLRPNTQRSYRNSLGKASALLRDSHGRSVAVDAIEAEDVMRIRDTLANGQGANQAVRSISALYVWASAPGRKHAASNPAKGIPLLDEGEHEPWPDWLVEEALSDPIVKASVALLYFSGQRIGDVVAMQWTDIQNGMIEVKQQKTDIPLSVAMLPELTQILGELPRKGFTILTNANGDQWTTSGLRQMIQAWAKTKGQKIVPHGLRKNAVNALLEAGCSVAEVNAITGQDLKTIEHYAKKRDRSKLGRAAIHKLDDARKARNRAGT
jgi:integrase